jgi:uncharacterized protein (UPF0332 family)
MTEKTLDEAIKARSAIHDTKMFIRSLKEKLENKGAASINVDNYSYIALCKEEVEQFIEILQHRIDDATALLESL